LAADKVDLVDRELLGPPLGDHGWQHLGIGHLSATAGRERPGHRDQGRRKALRAPGL